MNVYDAGVAAEHVAIFEADKLRSTEITVDAWRNRSWYSRLRDRLAGLLDGRM